MAVGFSGHVARCRAAGTTISALVDDETQLFPELSLHFLLAFGRCVLFCWRKLSTVLADVLTVPDSEEGFNRPDSKVKNRCSKLQGARLWSKVTVSLGDLPIGLMADRAG